MLTRPQLNDNGKERQEIIIMHTKASLLNDLRKTNIYPEGTLLIHSSMKAIAEVAGGAETVLDALIAFMEDGVL